MSRSLIALFLALLPLLCGCRTPPAAEEQAEAREISSYRLMAEATEHQLAGRHRLAADRYLELWRRYPRSPRVKLRLAASLVELRLAERAAPLIESAWPQADPALRRDAIELIGDAGSVAVLEAGCRALLRQLSDPEAAVDDEALGWALGCGLALVEVGEPGALAEAPDDPELIGLLREQAARAEDGPAPATIGARDLGVALTLQAHERGAPGGPVLGAIDSWLDARDRAGECAALLAGLHARRPSAPALERLGLLRLAQGRPRRALGCWRQALALRADPSLARRASRLAAELGDGR